eukprot:1317842-Prymnesium_polylepis.1
MRRRPLWNPGASACDRRRTRPSTGACGDAAVCSTEENPTQHNARSSCRFAPFCARALEELAAAQCRVAAAAGCVGHEEAPRRERQ